MPEKFGAQAVAHIRQADSKKQSLYQHLLNVAKLTEEFAAKANLPLSGRLLGLLHDFGKYSNMFQRYINSSTGFLDQDSDDYLDPVAHKSKIDHSTAGAQIAWEHFRQYGAVGAYFAQMLALAVCSHHSGLIDCLSPLGDQTFLLRMDKEDAKTHRKECLDQADRIITSEIERLLSRPVLLEMQRSYSSISLKAKERAHKALSKAENDDNENSKDFQVGLLVRFLLSCLLDADRIDSAEFEDPAYAALRERLPAPDWQDLILRLEGELTQFTGKEPIHDLRRDVSQHCATRGENPQGLFTLTVPTGGGKTLASLRFALTHAAKHNLDRIIYIIPYTSIVDQNAKVARSIFEQGQEPGSVVLEQHSNIQPENDSWQGRLLAPNWDAPIVFTTMVQFLEALFGSGTRGARRMHTLAKSVIIFDEIQTLPVRCAHMFCNALNFLAAECGTSAVLCTATQPLLDSLPNPFRGHLKLDDHAEIIPNVNRLFADLKRVCFVNHCHKYMDAQSIAALTLEELAQKGSCLVVTNTKDWAKKLYTACLESGCPNIFYLSTNLCPPHRMALLEKIHVLLKNKEPVLCFSTQLIECGVDISFGAVIRFAAGLDSILQAAGRCNRHREAKLGSVHIVTVDRNEEHLEFLEDIAAGRDIFLRVIQENDDLLAQTDYDLTRPEIMDRYFAYYFYRRAKDMAYAITKKSDSSVPLLYMLGTNEDNPGSDKPSKRLQQSFATAASLFRPIKTATQGILVPYKQGREIISDLCSASGMFRKRELLRAAQRYTVNVYPNMFKALSTAKALFTIPELGIICLKEGYYNEAFGVSTEFQGNMTTEIH